MNNYATDKQNSNMQIYTRNCMRKFSDEQLLHTL